MGLPQVLLHVATVLLPPISWYVTPCTGRALVKRGTAVDAVSHAVGPGVSKVGGASVVIVDAAMAHETLSGPGDVVYCVV